MRDLHVVKPLNRGDSRDDRLRATTTTYAGWWALGRRFGCTFAEPARFREQKTRDARCANGQESDEHKQQQATHFPQSISPRSAPTPSARQTGYKGA